jgi:hypothetical protein
MHGAFDGVDRNGRVDLVTREPVKRVGIERVAALEPAQHGGELRPVTIAARPDLASYGYTGEPTLGAP